MHCSSKMLSAASLSVLALLLVVVAWNGSTAAATPANSSSSNDDSWINSVRRKLFLYSEISKPPPDPDAILPDEDTMKQLAADHGKWRFWDGEEEDRPNNDKLCDDFPPYCDISGDDFPDDSWQADAVYVNHILNDADGLLARAMEAIFAEYGHPKPDTATGLAERMKMFHWDKLDMSTATGKPDAFQKRGKRGNGGWTTKRSFDGLVKRLLHAIMTNSEFTVVLAGHSAAAGHGNHFRQSYVMQMHKVLAPVMARLGVKLVTHNFSQGGLGTLQNAMGAGDLYGKEIDILLWDTAMTENDGAHLDFFIRQVLLAGNKVPIVWAASGSFQVLKDLHELADVDIGEYGNGMDGIEETTSDEQAKTLPHAVAYTKCAEGKQAICQEAGRYCATCWIDRDDGVKPEAKQSDHPAGQVKWHPGWRSHQLQGRVLAFAVMEALQVAVQEFSEGTMGGPPLADDYWHIGDYYKNIQTKLKNLGPGDGEGACYRIKEHLPERMCNTVMKARSQFTPRLNFDETSIISILKPADDGYVPKNEKKPLYEGEDAHNSCYDIPPGDVDALAIISGRRRVLSEEVTQKQRAGTFLPAKQATKHLREGSDKVPIGTKKNQLESGLNLTAEQHRDLGDKNGIKPGKGWELAGEPQGYCDGSYYSVCNRWTHSDCVLLGHHDARGHIVGNGFSGWIVMTLKDLVEGIIVIRVETWNDKAENTITEDWQSENNEKRRTLEIGGGAFDDTEPLHGRALKNDEPGAKYPENFVFEYAVNGKITSLKKKEFLELKKRPQRVIETVTLLDDPAFTDKETDVELAIRVTGGCGRDCTISISHVYWA